MPIITPKFRVSFSHVFEPQYNKLSKQHEYSLDAVFDDDEDLSMLKNAAEQAMKKKFGDDKDAWPKQWRSPFKKKQDRVRKGTQQRYDGYEGEGVYLTLKTKERPQIVDANKQEIIEPSEFYPGCWARASVNVYAYDNAGNRGVNFGLNNIQKLKDDTPFGNRTTAEMDFESVAGNESSSNSASDLFN